MVAAATRAEVDGMLASLRPSPAAAPPKGLSAHTLETVGAHPRSSPRPLSSVEVAGSLDLSRVTARRYLEPLVATTQVTRTPRHGTPGRPELEYRPVG